MQAEALGFDAGERRLVEIGASRTLLHADPSEASALFASQGAIVCPDVFEPALLERLLDGCRSAQFVADKGNLLGTRQLEQPMRIGRAISFLLERSNFLRWIEAATGRGSFDRVVGKVVQTRAGSGDALKWHDDMRDESRRALGITINLTDFAYTGGQFEMRNVGDRSSLRRFHHQCAGTALIFAVDRGRVHRLTPLESGGPRRVYTGWFLYGPGSAT